MKSFDLPASALGTGFSAGGGNLFYSIPNIEPDKGGGANLIDRFLEQTDISRLDINPSNYCWFDEKNLYFQGIENTIYRYSVEKNSAFLVYQNNNSDDFIKKISCSDENIYFSIDSGRDGELDMYHHYKLSVNPRSGKPIEEVLPLFFTVDGDAYQATLGINNKVMVETIGDSNNNGFANQSKVKAVLNDDLGFEGVITDNLVYEFLE